MLLKSNYVVNKNLWLSVTDTCQNDTHKHYPFKTCQTFCVFYNSDRTAMIQTTSVSPWNKTWHDSQFPVNSEIYHFDTKQHANFHQPSVNVTTFQKSVSNVGHVISCHLFMFQRSIKDYKSKWIWKQSNMIKIIYSAQLINFRWRINYLYEFLRNIYYQHRQ